MLFDIAGSREDNTEWNSMEKGSGVRMEEWVFLGMLFNFARLIE